MTSSNFGEVLAQAERTESLKREGQWFQLGRSFAHIRVKVAVRREEMQRVLDSRLREWARSSKEKPKKVKAWLEGREKYPEAAERYALPLAVREVVLLGAATFDPDTDDINEEPTEGLASSADLDRLVQNPDFCLQCVEFMGFLAEAEAVERKTLGEALAAGSSGSGEPPGSSGPESAAA